MLKPYFDRETGIESHVQTLAGFHELVNDRLKHRGSLDNWLIHGKWVLTGKYLRYIWPWFRDLGLKLPDVLPFESLHAWTPRFSELTLDRKRRQYLMEYRGADDVLGAIRCGMLDPSRAEFPTFNPAPAHGRCAMCGIGWTMQNAEYFVTRDYHFGPLRDDRPWHEECNLMNLGPSVEPRYRTFLQEAGFAIRKVTYEPNGHAPFAHMPPWCTFQTNLGAIRMGWLVSALHIDYQETAFTGDLLPEKPERTRRLDRTIEVEGKEIPLCLNRLHEALLAA